MKVRSRSLGGALILAFVAIPDARHQALVTHNSQFSAPLKDQLAKLGVRAD